MTKKYGSRKERNKFLRISGQAKKAAEQKKRDRVKTVHDVIDTLKRVNAHNAEMKAKHPQLFLNLVNALKNVELSIEEAASQIGVDREDIIASMQNNDGQAFEFDMSHIREVQAELRSQYTMTDIIAAVGADLADQGQWQIRTYEEVREDFIVGLMAFAGFSREQAERYAIESVVKQVTDAASAIHASRQESIQTMPDGSLLIGEMRSPFANATNMWGIAGESPIDQVMRNMSEATGIPLEELSKPIDDGLIEEACKEEMPESERMAIPASKWHEGVRHSNDVREVIKHTQSEK